MCNSSTHLTIRCTSQDHRRSDNATSGSLKLLKYASIEVVHNENGLIVVVNHILKASVRVCHLPTEILQLNTLIVSASFVQPYTQCTKLYRPTDSTF